MNIDECLGLIQRMRLEVGVAKEGETRVIQRNWRAPVGASVGTAEVENDGKKGLQNMLNRAKESDPEVVKKMGIMEVPMIPPWSVMVDDPMTLNDPDREKISVFPVGLIAPKQVSMAYSYVFL